MEPLDDAIDHVRGPSGAPEIVEYGDYECPYSRRAFREIERVEKQTGVRFEADMTRADVGARIQRDVESGLATAEVHGTPTIFVDGVVHRGAYEAAALIEALAR